MVAIENYVETMFMNLPETEEIQHLKNDILLNMIEKYEELVSQGMTENEAIGSVISEFGNVDELLNELEIKKETKNNNIFNNDFPTLGIDEIDEYIAIKRETAVGIGLGVIGCGMGVAAILMGLQFNLIIIGIVTCIAIVAISVGLFVMNGLKLSKFNHLEKGFFLNHRNREYIVEEDKNYTKSFTMALVIGIVICILSSIPVLIGSQRADYILLYTAVTVVISTIGCFFLIYAGCVKSSYSFLLENAIDESISQKELDRKMFWKKFNDSFWLIIVAVYLLISFVFNNWSISWIIFPVAGVLSGLWVKEN